LTHKSDVVIDLLVAELTNDGSSCPKEAAVFVPFKGRNKDLGHRTQEPVTGDLRGVDDVLEALRDRFGDVLEGLIDVCESLPNLAQQMKCRVFLSSLDVE